MWRSSEWLNSLCNHVAPSQGILLSPEDNQPQGLCANFHALNSMIQSHGTPKGSTKVSGAKGSFFVLRKCPFAGKQSCTLKLTWGSWQTLWDLAGWLFCAVWTLKDDGLVDSYWYICKSLDVSWSVLSEETKVNVRPENPVGIGILAHELLHDNCRSSLETVETLYCGTQTQY